MSGGVPALSAVALVGGNCSNGTSCGAAYVNLNNSAGNANWNIGASNFFSYGALIKCSPYPTPHGENYSGYRVGLVSLGTKTDRR